jgi:hypothetical protein
MDEMDETDETENNDLKICLISRAIARLNYRVTMMTHRTACETIIKRGYARILAHPLLDYWSQSVE